MELKDPTIPTPPAASQRIVYSPFREMLKERWNEELAHAVHAARTYEIPWGYLREQGSKVVDSAKAVTS